jgi:hypothetical protein
VADFTWTLIEAAPAAAPAAPEPTGGETVHRDLLMDADGDLAQPGGDLASAAGAPAIAQALRMRLALFAGEWFLDLDAGVPYFEQVLVKNPNMTAIRAVFRREILATPGVLGLLYLTLNYAAADRSLRLDFAVSTALGELNARLEVTA